MSALPELMNAIVSSGPGGPETLGLRQVPLPQPGPGEVLIRVKAVGVNPVDQKTMSSVDIAKFIYGRDPWSDGSPVIPGWDVSGEVAAVGSGVARFKVGDRVFGTVGFPARSGAYAEYICAHVSQISLSPRNLDDVHTAALPMAWLTGWQALVDACGMETGQRVLIIGASGGVGHLAVQTACDLGVEVVAAASPENFEFLQQLGASQVVDRSKPDWLSEVEPVDAVLDCGGHADVFQAALKRVKPGGSAVTLGSSALPAQPVEGVDTHWILIAPDGLELQLLTGSVVRGALSPQIQQTLPLAEAAKAFELIASGKTRGKIVLTV